MMGKGFHKGDLPTLFNGFYNDESLIIRPDNWPRAFFSFVR